MRGLGWMYADYGDDGIREIFNDRRLLENLACNVPGGLTRYVTGGQLCFAYGYRWMGCGGAYTTTGHFEAIDFALDPAPWDGLYGDDAFLGYWVDSWEGFPVEYDRSVNRRGWSHGGANFTALRAKNLSMTYEVVMVGLNENALNTGLEYLRESLAGPDGCASYEVVVFDDCDPNSNLESYWRLRDVGVLEMPRWLDEPVVELGCVFRRAMFVLGARDPYRYRCPEECLAETDLVAPAPVGDCYTWEEWFCNDDLAQVCCALTSPTVGGGAYAALITIRAGLEGAPPFWINDGGVNTWITKPLAAGESLEIDNAMRTLTFTSSLGVRSDGAPYVVTDGGPPEFPVVSRWSDSLQFCVRPYRICGMDGASVQIDRVLRVG